MLRLITRALGVAVTTIVFATEGYAAQSTASGEIPHTRQYFYVGGAYVDDGSGGHVFRNQMYVEQLTPITSKPKQYPIVFIHGQAQTGTNWLNKPDSTPSWSSYFLSHNYTLYLIDQTSRGRSPAATDAALSSYSAELLQQRFTSPETYNLWPQASLHTQWPGAANSTNSTKGKMGDAVFDAYYASTIPFLSTATLQQSTVQSAGAALLDRIGEPVILLAHSQGGIMPWLIADVRPDLTHAIVSLEPSGPPFHEAIFSTSSARAYGLSDIPLTYSPAVSDPSTDLIKATVPANDSQNNYTSCTIQASNSTASPKQLINLAGIPTLLVTMEASYHAVYDWCTVRYLKQAGVSVKHLQLGEVGVHGNGHMVFMEKNSDVVAGLIDEWIEQN